MKRRKTNTPAFCRKIHADDHSIKAEGGLSVRKNGAMHLQGIRYKGV